MNNTIFFFQNSVAQVFLSKKKLFGIININVSFLLTNSLKIIKILNPNKVEFLYKQGDTLQIGDFSRWVVNNNFEFTFSTKSKTLKRTLFLEVEYTINQVRQNKSKSLFSKLIKWLIT